MEAESETDGRSPRHGGLARRRLHSGGRDRNKCSDIHHPPPTSSATATTSTVITLEPAPVPVTDSVAHESVDFPPSGVVRTTIYDDTGSYPAFEIGWDTARKHLMVIPRDSGSCRLQQRCRRSFGNCAQPTARGSPLQPHDWPGYWTPAASTAATPTQSWPRSPKHCRH